MENQKNQYIPCFLCGGKLRVKFTKNEKPYFICDPCGLQVFVRCKPGISKLKTLLEFVAEKAAFNLSGNNSAFEFAVLAGKLADLKEKRLRLLNARELAEVLLPSEAQAHVLRKLDRDISKMEKRLSDLH